MANGESSEDPDLACVEKIRAGGSAVAEAVTSLYRAYRRPLLAFFMRNGVTQEVGEDLLQEVFISVVRHVAEFNGQSRVSTWLWSIARNRLIDHVRARKPEINLDDDGWAFIADTTPGSVQQGAREGMEECVQRALQAFARQAPERAEVLRRASLDEWSMDDIARFIGRNAGATREYLSQCRKKFKVFLEPCQDFLRAQGA